MSENERVCNWREEDGGGPYETDCGHLFECISDGPEENGFRFCCFCGGKLAVGRYDDGIIATKSKEGR